MRVLYGRRCEDEELRYGTLRWDVVVLRGGGDRGSLIHGGKDGGVVQGVGIDVDEASAFGGLTMGLREGWDNRRPDSMGRGRGKPLWLGCEVGGFWQHWCGSGAGTYSVPKRKSGKCSIIDRGGCFLESERAFIVSSEQSKGLCFCQHRRLLM